MRRVLRQQVVDAALLLLAILAAVAVIVSHHWRDNRPSDEPMGSLIPILAETEPRTLVFKRAGHSVRLVNGAAAQDSPQWLVESPWKRPADAPTVDGATIALRDMQIVRQLPVVATDLTRLGLDQPLFTWEAEIDGGIWSVAFGAQAPSPRSGTYVDVTPPGSQNHHFYVVTADLAKLALEPDQLADRRLVPYVPSDFGTLTLRRGTRQARFNFDDTCSRWFSAEAPHYRASRTALEEFLLQLTTLKAEQFVAPEAAVAKAFASESTIVTLGLRKAQTPVNVEFGGACERGQSQSMVSVSGAEGGVACADVRNLLVALEKGLSDWADARLFSLRPDEIESISFTGNGSPLKLERSESGFRATNGGSPTSIDLDVGNQLLEEVTSTYGTLVDPSVLRGASFDAKRTVSVVSSVVAGQDRYEERVELGPALAHGERYVRRTSDSAVLRVSARGAASLLSDETRLTSVRPITDAGQD